jgi:hypothetical protein
MKRRENGLRMPPLASQIPDADAQRVLEDWIKGLVEEKKR